MSSTFLLAQRIAADTVPVAQLMLSDLRLMDDARFPWLVLVPRIAEASEILDLDIGDRAALFDEIIAVSATLRTVTRCDKLNVAALGNVVRQLHVHVIARFEKDPAWPQPVWCTGERLVYETGKRDDLIARIRAGLPA
jgi:diadenosine tetraphosphate (Ap4A) HIT family hydrolase